MKTAPLAQGQGAGNQFFSDGKGRMLIIDPDD